jgi:hypothetical protein
LTNRKIIKPTETVSPDLEKTDREGLVNDRFSGAVSWEIAKRFGLSKMEGSSAFGALETNNHTLPMGAF